VKEEWWTPPAKFTTNSEGKIDFQGFYGDYELSCAGKTIPFQLTPKKPDAFEIKL
jgi:hypothetical protein